MNNKQYSIIISLLLFFFFSCSSDSDENAVAIEVPQTEEITVDFFSSEYAYTDGTVSIIGDNFNTDLTQVKVYLDNVSVEIVSISKNNITIKIPPGINNSPNLLIEIPNSNVSFNNDTFKKIAILDNTKNKWITIKNNFNEITSVKNLTAIDKEKIYFSLKEGAYPFRVRHSFNGGNNIYLFNQFYNFFEGGFYLSHNENEYSYRVNLLYRKSKGMGESELLHDFSQESSASWPLDFFVDEVGNEKNITVVTSEGRIFKSTNNGDSFEKTHENDPSNFEFEAFFALSNNQMWLGGYTYPFGEKKSYYPAKILYLKEDGNWHNISVEIAKEDGYYEFIKKIHFVNSEIGYAIARVRNSNTEEEKYVIIKSETKGETWTTVHEKNEKIESFTFKDENIGWYISGNEIFKTIDGGTSWQLDYSNDTECKAILYTDDILWVIANEKILKYYF